MDERGGRKRPFQCNMPVYKHLLIYTGRRSARWPFIFPTAAGDRSPAEAVPERTKIMLFQQDMKKRRKNGASSRPEPQKCGVQQMCSRAFPTEVWYGTRKSPCHLLRANKAARTVACRLAGLQACRLAGLQADDRPHGRPCGCFAAGSFSLSASHIVLHRRISVSILLYGSAHPAPCLVPKLSYRGRIENERKI